VKDLALVVADKNMEFAVRGILGRHAALNIRPSTFEIKTHRGHDGGVRTNGPELLRLFHQQCHHGMLILDWEGSCTKKDSPGLEAELDERLANDWGGRSKAIVIEPELDIWVWGSDNAMAQVLGWDQGRPIREWLTGRCFTFQADGKPDRPKEALQTLMEHLGRPRSSALYEEFARKISLPRCKDPAFNRLKTILQSWFPA